MSDLLQSLIYTSQRAGGAIMAVYATDFSVHGKADESPVTAADEAAEKIILADLAIIAPGVPVTHAELRFSVLHEGALTASDLLDRRFRVGLVVADRSAALSAAEAAILAGSA